MAMVLDAFTSYVGGLLKQAAEEELGMLLGVSGEIHNMDVKLRDLNNFLADAEKKRITDQTVQEWVGELKRAMYEATDILDLCQLKVMEGGPSASNKGCINPLLFCLRNPLHAHDIGSRIKALNKRLNDINKRSDAFRFVDLGRYEDRCREVQSSRPGNGRPNRETAGEFDRSGVVGDKIKEDARNIVQILLTEKQNYNNVMVVAIVGAGGIGKSTLAQKVFNSEAINASFDKVIWLSINQAFDQVKLLRDAITLAGGDHRGGETLSVLQPILVAVVKEKKLLVLMDDMWSPGAWDDVLQTPLVNNVARGSRVLVTTRAERVARGLRAVPPYHHVDKLSHEDAWLLLKKQVVSSEMDDSRIDMLKDIGLKIIAKCDGLPLAVKVMGGLLCQMSKQKRDWEMVLNDSVWSVSRMPEEINYTVYLSYEDLHPCVKQCFLHYCLLPKKVAFDRHAIAAMWISEGFLHGNSDDLEELGSKYFEELLLRNLIEPDTKHVIQYKCGMHDVVRSFGQYVARDEALVVHSAETSHVSKLNPERLLRLSLERQGSASDKLEWRSLEVHKSLRTLIVASDIGTKPGDSLSIFPYLRTLHIESANTGILFESLCQLKHLRYLSIAERDIRELPDNIEKMKLLQYINLAGCGCLVKLPDGIIKLVQLRTLVIGNNYGGVIPKGFRGLTNLSNLDAYPAHMVDDWCSLEELGPLSQLRFLTLRSLENVSAASFAGKINLATKKHLNMLTLMCGNRVGDAGQVREEEVQQIKKVFDELCPPPSLCNLGIIGYFGRQLPRWMMSISTARLESLTTLLIDNLACCTQLPDVLCQLPCLEILQIRGAPAIKHVGPEFLYCNQVGPAFPRLQEMKFIGMVAWEEWDWEEQLEAMLVLESLEINSCRLRQVPPGLASHAKALKVLSVFKVQCLKSLENFASLVELKVYHNPDMERINNLPNLQKLVIVNCPMLQVLVGVPALQRLVLEDYTMETLPEYMRDVSPRHLLVDCRPWLLASIAAGMSGLESDKFSHVEHVKANAPDGNIPRKWYVMCTKNPYKLETNICHSFTFAGTLSLFEDVQEFESLVKMTRKTFEHICSLVKVPLVEDMIATGSSHTTLNGRVLSLEDVVAVALVMLNTGSSLETVGTDVGVKSSTVSWVRWNFIQAMQKQRIYPTGWPGSGQIEVIKSKFENIYGLPNCCGVVDTTHIIYLSSAAPNCEVRYDDENNCRKILQVVVDPDMRFSFFQLAGWSGSVKQPSILHKSYLFEQCEKGMWLNGSKLKVSNGSEVGEYVIGDAEYPLLPWLLTPYQEKDLSDSQVDFNKRHLVARTVARKALARLKDTWNFLDSAMRRPNTPQLMCEATVVCCMLHNIVIDMENGQMPSNGERKMRRLAGEDAVRARDILSEHLTNTSSLSAERINTEERWTTIGYHPRHLSWRNASYMALVAIIILLVCYGAQV